MYEPELIDTIRPDHPAGSALRILAHWGGLEFVQLTSMTGPDEDWTIQLDRDQTAALADSLRFALARLDRRRAETDTCTQGEAELAVGEALRASTGDPLDWETISDAVDVHLGRLEREHGHPINRDAIPRLTVQAVRDTIVLDAQAHRA
ncbi:hypothetical protein DQ226_13970 [Dietzia maris]|uniref:Uncharacterized protein n=1 Tax=Dietzia maris TaxID=37915 RepID=A0A365P7T4_9ACTN|nr:hypothetical protein [Dietzia sp. UCD-THP]EYT54389.1 hypothetical protein H483_0117460 [Dietzia sp. UCD-THP]RBA32490.1 hypothetical protein DQ226_13970 [Dietzia maris]